MKGLNLFQRLLAYVLFLSIVIRFIACQLTKGFTTDRQVKEFRYFSFAGLIGLLIAILVSSFDEVGSFALLYSWFGFFVVAEMVERKFHLSKLFEE
jgi:FtsH-binding integral membrane protein